MSKRLLDIPTLLFTDNHDTEVPGRTLTYLLNVTFVHYPKHDTPSFLTLTKPSCRLLQAASL